MFAAERVAEIKMVLETKGVDAKGLEIAEARLREHLGEAAEIIIKQRNKGNDVSDLAKEFDDKLETPRSELANSFNAEKKALKAKEDDLKNQIKAARRALDNTRVEALTQELGQVQAQLELLELKEEELEDNLDAEEEKIEDEMDAREEAEDAIQDAEKQKQDALAEAEEKGITLPANAFSQFDSLLAQAKSALQAGNYEEAERLAEQTGDALELIEEDIDDTEPEMDNKEDAEEAFEDVDEVLEGETENDVEQAEENRGEEQRQKEAEKQPDEAEEQQN